MSSAEFIIALIGAAGTAAGAVSLIHYRAKESRLAEIESKRQEAADTIARAAAAAADLKLREQEAKTEDRSATAELLRNLTDAYDSLAATMGGHIASLENRVRDLEAIVHDRDNAIRDRDNVIRRLREHVHMANGELFKAGLREFIRQPADIIEGVANDPSLAPERRDPPIKPPAVPEA